MRMLRSFALLALLSMLGACASQIVEPDIKTTPRPVMKALESISVDLSPKAKEQLADNVKFDVDALRRKLELSLKSRNLIAPDGDYRLKVSVTDIRVRGTFSAVMLGFMAGDDHLIGDNDLLKKPEDGKEGGDSVYQFKVKTSYAFGGLAGGQDSMRIDWLYEEFSKKVAEKLMALRDGKQ